jgi:hypothetical protein
MKQLRRALTLILIGLALLLSGARNLTAEGPSQPNQGTQTKAPTQQHSAVASPSKFTFNQGTPIPTAETGAHYNHNQHSQSGPWGDLPGWLQAIATIALVIFAARQMRFVRRGTTATENAANAARDNAIAAQKYAGIAERTLILTQRPKLVVRNVVIEQVRPFATVQPLELFAPGQHVNGHLYVTNVGGSKATIQFYSCRGLPIQGGLPMERPDEGFQGIPPTVSTLESGESHRFEFSSEQVGNEGPLIRQGNNGWAFYVMGWIQYSDDIGTLRRTLFCRRWGVVERRLFPVKDPDYEQEN